MLIRSFASAVRRLALLACTVFAFSGQAAAQTATPGPISVETTIYVYNLSAFDVARASFVADFYLEYECKPSCAGIDIEFMNGRASNLDKITDEPGKRAYRVYGTFQSPLDFRKFPFDQQALKIVLEDKRKKSGELTFVPNTKESGLDDEISLPGWLLSAGDIMVAKKVYEGAAAETFSRLTFEVKLSKSKINGSIKVFLPIIFVTMIVTFGYVLGLDHLKDRITLSATSLVATVMFHVNVTNQLPPLSYFTLADVYLGCTYAFILMTIGINVFMLEKIHEGQKPAAERIWRFCRHKAWIVPAVYTVAVLSLGI